MQKLSVCLILLLAGCVSVSSIRSKAPYLTMQSSKSPKEIADCVLHQAPGKINSAMVYYHFSQSEDPPGTFHILIDDPMQARGEADFKPQDKGTAIELRSNWNFWAKDTFWSCIQECASSTTTPGKN